VSAPGHSAPGLRENGPGPVFVSGRQHSGNTVLTMILGRAPGCFAQTDENIFFERRALIDRIADPERRAAAVAAELRIDRVDRQLSDRIAHHLAEWIGARPEARALDLFREGMRFACEATGRRFWCQKATSYIFYGREILTLMPEARLLYMLRNPYDICASRKRRADYEERIWGHMVSWNQGIRLARRLGAEFPDRFRIVKYEDLTAAPEPTVRGVFEFLGVPFDRSVLDIPHVNRSESKYKLESESRGLNTSRINYYMNNLSAAEIAALDMLADRRMIRESYPELPHRASRASTGTRLRAAGLIVKGPFHFARDYLSKPNRSPMQLLARSIRRIGLLRGGRA